MTNRPNRVVAFESELDEPVRSALTEMIDAKIPESDIESSLQRIKRSNPSPQRLRATQLQSRSPFRVNRISLAISASVLVLLVIASSTDAWAQVVSDYAHPRNEPQPMSTLASPGPPAIETTSQGTSADSSNASTPVSGFVLLIHVSSLMLGLVLMLLSWLSSIAVWIRSLSSSKLPNKLIERFQFLSLRVAALLYVVGIGFGCLWSQSAWGRYWSWHPKEAFGLLTVGLCVLWLRGLKAAIKGDELSLFRYARAASTSTIAFGTVALMLVLGGIYADPTHTYGLPTRVPTGIVVITGSLLSAIWITCFLQRQRSDSYQSKDAIRE